MTENEQASYHINDGVQEPLFIRINSALVMVKRLNEKEVDDVDPWHVKFVVIPKKNIGCLRIPVLKIIKSVVTGLK